MVADRSPIGGILFRKSQFHVPCGTLALPIRKIGLPERRLAEQLRERFGAGSQQGTVYVRHTFIDTVTSAGPQTVSVAAIGWPNGCALRKQQ